MQVLGTARYHCTPLARTGTIGEWIENISNMESFYYNFSEEHIPQRDSINLLEIKTYVKLLNVQTNMCKKCVKEPFPQRVRPPCSSAFCDRF